MKDDFGNGGETVMYIWMTLQQVVINKELQKKWKRSIFYSTNLEEARNMPKTWPTCRAYLSQVKDDDKCLVRKTTSTTFERVAIEG